MELIGIIVTTLVGIITIIAIYYSPIVALRVQKEIEAGKEQMQQKMNIFKTLMATRAEPVSSEHVKALNMIDVEFYNDKEITSTWNAYRDHLNSYPQDEVSQKIWYEKTSEHLTNLLFEMAQLLGFTFDKVLLKKGAYAPIAHGTLNAEQAIMRKNFIELLSGNKCLKVELIEKTDK